MKKSMIVWFVTWLALASWEWTSSTDANGLYIIKGGSWDSDRDDCRSEKSDVVRDGSLGYANVGFRVVRTGGD